MRPNITNMQRDVLVLNMEAQLAEISEENFGKGLRELDDPEFYRLLLLYTKRLLSVSERIGGEKRVYYLSMEFLVGPQLEKNLVNLGIYNRVSALAARTGHDLVKVVALEREPSLGNGGLGRLAACYLDASAGEGLPVEGVGLRYHFGLFRQSFADHKQVEHPDRWIDASGWDTPTDQRYEVELGSGKVTGRLYDLDVVGYNNGINKLRLFDVESVDESIAGEGIAFDKTAVEKALTLYLYPDDSDEAGRKLRLYQEVFLVRCAAQQILHELKLRQYDLRRLPDYAVVQINDTHPALIIPELIRILVVEKAFTFEEAAVEVERCCAYTNHTILAEALETWPMHYIQEVAPQIVPILRQLDALARQRTQDPSMAIIDEHDVVHMANLCIHFSFSVNGVAELHTRILKERELKSFAELYPEKFSNKTNGISLRRFLYVTNEELTDFITQRIGSRYKEESELLQRLMEFGEDEISRSKVLSIRDRRKNRLAVYSREQTGIELIPFGIYDVQIKRFHEYKRQQLHALAIIHEILEIRRGNKLKRPINHIFAGKAAPSYVLAKDVLHLLLCLQDLVQRDAELNHEMRVVVLPDYSVTVAQEILPAADISEQISLASMEASGTGNMKMMLNGAVTLGTRDGANLEIGEAVGPDNIYFFGMDVREVSRVLAAGSGEAARAAYARSQSLREALDFIVSDEMKAIGDAECLERLYHALLDVDRFLTLPDYEDYIRARDEMMADFEDRPAWAEKMIRNIAASGAFSADRSIEEYDREIWKLTRV